MLTSEKILKPLAATIASVALWRRKAIPYSLTSPSK
jgi:hypothetical protein